MAPPETPAPAWVQFKQGDELSLGGMTYESLRIMSRTEAAITLHVRDELGRQRCARLQTDTSTPSFRDIRGHAASLEASPEFARFVDAGLAHVTGSPAPVEYFLEEWVHGPTLAEVLRRDDPSVGVSLIVGFVDTLTAALSALRGLGLSHTDLSADRIILAQPPEWALGQVEEFRVIGLRNLCDIGDDELYQQAQVTTDHRLFVEHLIALHNAVLRGRPLSIRERRFLRGLLPVITQMLETDWDRALTNPRTIRDSIRGAYTASASHHERAALSLESPFDYLSAEHIADDRLLVRTFADSCPWLEKVARPSPSLVVGPRGCGKSTIFRWLSLKAHLHREDLDSIPAGLAGFYVSCGADLQNRFNEFTDPARAAEFREDIIHYFNLVVLREVIETLVLIADRGDAEAYWGLGPYQERRTFDYIVAALQVHDFAVGGVSLLQQCLELVEDQLFKTFAVLRRGDHSKWPTGETFLGDFSRRLATLIPAFQERRITFLIDDYSTHRVPSAVQRILNRLVAVRAPSHIFKLSAESYGTELQDDLGVPIDAEREIEVVDCGLEFVSLSDGEVQRARTFASQLLANRLKAASYLGTPAELLGHSDWGKHGTLARALRARADRGRGVEPVAPIPTGSLYHGLECIADLCSGDVATLLAVYRRIFENASVTPDQRMPVPPSVQHEAIRAVSRETLQNLRTHFPAGPRQYVVANEFGRLVRRVLDNGALVKKGAAEPQPPQVPRIEIDQLDLRSEHGLTEDELIFLKALIRRSVFIDLGPGLSRHESALTLRLQLRRVYLPSFGAALAKNEAFKWRTDQLREFLTDPVSACRRAYRSYPKARPEDDESFPTLFQEENSGL